MRRNNSVYSREVTNRQEQLEALEGGSGHSQGINDLPLGFLINSI